MGSGGPKFLDFSKKKIDFFIVFWGDLEGAGTLCPYELKQHSKVMHY